MQPSGGCGSTNQVAGGGAHGLFLDLDAGGAGRFHFLGKFTKPKMHALFCISCFKSEFLKVGE